jgi:uncharacterized protein
MMNTLDIIKKYYTEGSELYKILISHSRHVAEKSLSIAYKHPELELDETFIAEACMLHDIGIFLCNAPSIHCFGTHQYVEHGYLGSEILMREGLLRHALVCERHTGTGISVQKIIERNLPLPLRDMRPVSIEEQVICYADKFFSKSKLGKPHSLDYITEHLAKYDKADVEIFMEWHRKFK